MPKSLLSHIANNFITQYENVANSSVCYLLNEYPAARQGLANALNMDAIPTHYETEEAAQSGRPDVTGKDAENNTTVIIEGKFWANLTENQPNGYLDELTAGGKLLFLAPDKRIRSLELELEKRIDGENDRVLVRSWNKFLNLIEVENNKNHDANLAGDLTQLKALCQKMDAEGMPPLSESDLDPMNGRLSVQLADVIDECNPIIRGWKHTEFSGYKSTSTKYGYGFYFRSNDFFGCYLYFSNYDWFMGDNRMPICLSVKEGTAGPQFTENKILNHALKIFDPENSWDHRLGIPLKPGMDKNRVVKHIVNRVKQTLEYLNSNVVR